MTEDEAKVHNTVKKRGNQEIVRTLHTALCVFDVEGRCVYVSIWYKHPPCIFERAKTS